MRDRAAHNGLDEVVYQPAEDSHLLAAACVEGLGPSMRVLDVGTGSGVVAAHVRETVGAAVIGIDINPHACRQAATRGIPAIRGNLVDPIRANSVDAIVCNPPYLPTEPAAEREDWLAVAVSGGETGRAVVAALLADAVEVLRADGVMYLLVSSLMNAEAVADDARKRGFDVSEVARDASFPFEVLSVLELRP